MMSRGMSRDISMGMGGFIELFSYLLSVYIHQIPTKIKNLNWRSKRHPNEIKKNQKQSIIIKINQKNPNKLGTITDKEQKIGYILMSFFDGPLIHLNWKLRMSPLYQSRN